LLCLDPVGLAREAVARRPRGHSVGACWSMHRESSNFGIDGSIFTRSSFNPILRASDHWWENRAVFNPGAVVYGGRIALVYRAVGADGISRFGLAWTRDGEQIEQRSELPWYESALDDPMARLGVEDPRMTQLGDTFYLTYCKASVAPAGTPKLEWETAPFRIRSGLGFTMDFSEMRERGTILPDTNTKDAVLFPEMIDGVFAALIREYPAIQLVTSVDLHHWSEPRQVLEPIPGTWQGERIGAGPPPLRTPWGWLLFYHGNEYLHMPGNQRMYRMGLAVLDIADPARVIYGTPIPSSVPARPMRSTVPWGMSSSEPAWSSSASACSSTTAPEMV
jgi:beta-1,2-mannobiose phosphorylase / 1,2-beta-oligomannan phosphorylase